MKGAVATGIIALGSVMVAHLLASDEVAATVTIIAITLPISMMALSFGLEEFRMNGMPYEKVVSGWLNSSK